MCWKTWLKVFVFAYVKNEGNHFHHSLTSLMSHGILGLSTLFVGSCWGHAMSKCCQYATNDSKICVGLTSISIYKNICFVKNHHFDKEKW
jgi:hypothetical protein